MRVGILTFHFIPNYGATLQCFALWRHLMDEGHEVSVLDYRPPRFLYLVYRNGILIPHLTQTVLRHPLRLLKPRSLFLPGWRERMRQQQRMLRWTRDHVRLTPRTCFTRRALKSLARHLDALIVGSDQIWDITNANGRNLAYFLDFAADAPCRRIAYAVSAGSLENFGEDTECLASLARRFHHISVRDRHTQAIVERDFGLPCTRVVDPVWLIDFSRLCGPRLVQDDYLLFANGEIVAEDQLRWVRRVAEAMHLRMVSVGIPERVADINLPTCRQDEWLSLFAHARYVVTNLFHGTNFAVHFAKPFTVLSSQERRAKLGSLLADLHLESRQHSFPEVLDLPPERVIYPDAQDVEQARKRMEPMIAHSRRFLREALAPTPR